MSSREIPADDVGLNVQAILDEVIRTTSILLFKIKSFIPLSSWISPLISTLITPNVLVLKRVENRLKTKIFCLVTTEGRKAGRLTQSQSASLDLTYLQAPIDVTSISPLILWNVIWPLLFVAAIFVHVGVIVNGVAYERTKKLRQGLSMMGLQVLPIASKFP